MIIKGTNGKSYQVGGVQAVLVDEKAYKQALFLQGYIDREAEIIAAIRTGSDLTEREIEVAVEAAFATPEKKSK